MHLFSQIRTHLEVAKRSMLLVKFLSSVSGNVVTLVMLYSIILQPLPYADPEGGSPPPEKSQKYRVSLQ